MRETNRVKKVSWTGFEPEKFVLANVQPLSSFLLVTVDVAHENIPPCGQVAELPIYKRDARQAEYRPCRIARHRSIEVPRQYRAWHFLLL